MRHLMIALLSACALSGCGEKNTQPAPTTTGKHAAESGDASTPSSGEAASNREAADNKGSRTEREFQQLSNQMVERMWRLFPSWAISNGYYQVAEQLQAPDQNYRQKVLSFARDYRNQFSRFRPEALSDNTRTDLALINNFLDETIWKLTVFKPHEWDPANYNVSHGFALILNTDYAPLDDRLRTFSNRMQMVPSYYSAAEQSLQNPASPQLMLGIQQNEGALSVFGEDLEETLAASGLTDKEKELFNTRLAATRTAINEYVAHLQTLHASMEKADSFHDFRIGEKLYEEKFRYDIQISMTGKELYERALREKDRLHLKMDELADKLWPKYFEGQKPPEDILEKISQVLEKLSEHHATKEDFKASVEEQIPELVEFVNDKNLLTLDPEKPLVVRTTPPYMRGFSVASINAPGPYDKDANTYYNVMPVEELPDDRAESFLREYNTYLMQILNIHEAIPGHYTQLIYANKSPSLIKNILGNGAMIEGWAVYTERMMLEAGYGDFSPELWMMYYKWNLRTVVNTILDYSIQVKGISEEQAMDLMMKQAFQQKTEAMGKWRRATLSQVQLTSYFAGYMDIMALREEIKEKLGDQFDLKQFHEKFLSYGNSPVPVIRELMLAEINNSSNGQ
ncbi:DUF885 domain-containing protein [Microbulbifer hydrolyticus]|uniref:DUF885 family protein n=1 Tax=Microbulbifer hydrolyticus TaxID=48074 RepID=A0A6P1T9L4_9GAMM|nr:DUF885 domain-containing protein [Microbulbifer hydrolyticus]MBB5210876.1 uncharacterized protein (DUF885 family) [Microbulbifer hydrolyticus]QHQ38697.1 DUF885 family protein [Microbulbifer hydrolyticus]